MGNLWSIEWKTKIGFLVLAGGKGEHLFPFSSVVPKCLFPVAGKPCVRWIVEDAIQQGFRDIVLCINKKDEPNLRNEFRDLDIKFSVSCETTGTVDELLFAQGNGFITETFILRYGDAGMIIKNNKELAEKLARMRNYGQSTRYCQDFVDVNSRLDEIQAAILRVKLPRLDEWSGRRRKTAKLYNDLLEGTKIATPVERKYAKHVYHLYVITHNERDGIKNHLMKNGIQTLIH